MTGRRLRVSVIGAGWYAAENHIPALLRRDDVELDGVCRLGAAELARVRDHFGFAFASEDYRAVLARDPDAVIVASPHLLHYEHARAALEAGAHVLCEKPFTLDPAEAWDLVARARRIGRHLLIANGYNYLPHMAALARLVQDGAVGRIEQASCQFSSATRQVFSGAVGFARWNTSFFRPDRATWQNPQAGGGFAYGQLSHSIALLLWITGLQPREVSARSFDVAGIDLQDAASVGFDGGAIGAVYGGAAVPEGGRARLRLSIAGSEGIADIDVDLDRCVIERHDGTAPVVAVAPGDWIYNCLGPVHALIDLAQGRGSNHSPPELGALTTMLIAAMRESALGGGLSVRCRRSMLNGLPVIE